MTTPNLHTFKNFKLIRTSRRNILKANGKTYQFEDINYKFLAEIQKYKKNILPKIETHEELKKWEFIKVPYSYKNNDLLKKYNNTNEILYLYDVKRAYINVLRDEKLINEDIYNMIYKYYYIDKTKVMQIIGSVCTRKVIETYENSKLIDKKEIQNNDGILIWNFIENKLNNKIREIMINNKNKILYYWFDEICATKPLTLNNSIFGKELVTLKNDTEIINIENGDIKELSFLKI